MKCDLIAHHDIAIIVKNIVTLNIFIKRLNSIKIWYKIYMTLFYHIFKNKYNHI